MDDVSIALNVILIIVIVLSISWASFAAWLLFEERWKRERKEKFVETVLLPLLEEVRGNLSRIDHHRLLYDSRGVHFVVSNAAWEGVRGSVLWDGLSCDGVKVLVENLYGEMDEYSDERWKVIRDFQDSVISVLNDVLLKKNESVDQVEIEKVRGAIKSEAYTLRDMGFDLYIEEGWNSFRDRCCEGVSQFIRDVCRQHSDVCEVSVSAENVFGVIRGKIEGDEESSIRRFSCLRETILEDGRNLVSKLTTWKNREYKHLVSKSGVKE